MDTLFEEYNVDLVAARHDHALKRTVPILNEKVSTNGIVYIGDGGLGVPTREVGQDRWYLLAMSVDNVHLVEFNHEQIRIRAIGMNGFILDEFSILSDRELRREYYQSLLDEAEELREVTAE